MATLKGSGLDRALTKPDPNHWIYLVYGPDQGLVLERSQKLASVLLGDAAKDPLSKIDFDDESISSQPEKLLEEAFSISMFAPNRVIRIRLGSKNIVDSINTILEGSAAPVPIIIEAGDLKKGGLRDLCEKSPHAQAIACYADTIADIKRLIEEDLQTNGQSISPKAMQLFLSRLGQDRGLTRQELEKLKLYTNGQKTIEEEDIRAITTDTSNENMDQLIDAVFSGQLEKLGGKSHSELFIDIPSQALITVGLRHAMNIEKWLFEIKAGRKRLAEDSFPEIFWSRRTNVCQQLRIWQNRNIARCIQLMEEAVLQSRQNYNLRDEIVAQTLLKVAGYAG